MKKHVLWPYVRALLFLVLVALLEYARFARVDMEDGITSDQFRLLAQSRVARHASELVMGDSVAAQLFNNDVESGDEYSMTGNCSSTLGGEYILLRNYLENNPQTTSVLMVVTPDLLSNEGENDYGYQYYVIPYYSEDNMQYITDDVQQYIDNRYGKIFTRNVAIRRILYNDLNLLEVYRNHLEEKNGSEVDGALRISWLSATYLKQIEELCELRGIELRVVCSPLPNVRANWDWDGFMHDIEAYGLQQILDGYIASAVYYSEDCFQDAWHLDNEFLEEHRKEIADRLRGRD